MAGCASMGDNKPQSTRIDASALDAGAAIRAADRDAGWPASDWWRAYGDPQLDAWIAAAQAGNPTLAAAQARVREAQAMARVARSAELPQINGNLSLMRQHWPDNVYYGPGPLADTDTWNNTGTLGLSYHLDLWGKDKNATERALDTAHATAADARAAKLELEVNVVRAYVGMSMNYALLDLARETFERQRALADLAHKRLQAGIGTQLEVSQAESTLPDYERQIDTYEEAIQLARHQLAALAGKGPGAGDAIRRPKLSLDAPAGLPSALPADLLGRPARRRRGALDGRRAGARDRRREGRVLSEHRSARDRRRVRRDGAVYRLPARDERRLDGRPRAVAADLRRRPPACATRRRECRLRSRGRALQPDDRRRAEGHRRPGRAHPLARYAEEGRRALGRRERAQLPAVARRLPPRTDRLRERAGRAAAAAACAGNGGAHRCGTSRRARGADGSARRRCRDRRRCARRARGGG
ncbi:fusaric acid resistance protein FusA, partial [Burkholderia multivorans ATCC BAA-247]